MDEDRRQTASWCSTTSLDPGAVQIDRHRLGKITPERPVQMLAAARQRPLDPLAVHATEILGALQRRRRRRRERRPQSRSGLVLAQPLHTGERSPPSS
jgi:hypothetical protein